MKFTTGDHIAMSILVTSLFLLLRQSSMFAVKPGALISNRPEIEHARRVAARVYASYGYMLTLTSGEERDTTHKAQSKHYDGLAEDYRTRDVRPGDREAIAANIQAILGRDYDVVLESDHLHVEFDPKV